MELQLLRHTFTAEATCGTLSGAGDSFVTLELPVKDGLPGSAIPTGLFQIVMLPSPKFEASTDPWVMKYAGSIPHVIGIPNRSNILIHFGNDAADTEGCILVGSEQISTDYIGGSRIAFAKLWDILTAAKGAGEPITLQVSGTPPTNAPDVQRAAAGDN